MQTSPLQEDYLITNKSLAIFGHTQCQSTCSWKYEKFLKTSWWW